MFIRIEHVSLRQNIEISKRLNLLYSHYQLMCLKKQLLNNFEADEQILRVLRKAFIILKDCSSSEFKASCLKIIGGCICWTSFAFQKRYSALVPWDYLQFLFFVDKKENRSLFDKYTSDFISQCAPQLVTNIDRIFLDESPAEMQERKNIEGMEPLYSMIDPLMDVRTLNLIKETCSDAQNYDISTKVGRIAILSSVKRVCELSKFSPEFRHMHPAIKEAMNIVN